MRYFVFVDTPYYPYVDEPIEADTLEAARGQVAETLRPGDETTVYLVPAEAVEAVSVAGPKRAPVGLLKLMQEHNRYTAAAIEAKRVHGGFKVSACARLNDA
jgi:hypothetical protein